MSKTSPDLSVVIPAYNEAKRLGPTLDAIVAYLSSRQQTFEVIVADDGSTDTTLEMVKGRGPAIRVVALGVNRGKGAAVRAGVAAAAGRMILFSDADLSTPIQEWERFQGRLSAGCDVVIGSRGLDASRIEIRQPWFREKMGRTFNWILRRILPLRFPDTQCGFKAFTAAAAHSLFRASQTDGFAFDAEILFLAELAGYRVEELGITWRNSAESRVSPVRHSFQMMRDLIRIRIRAMRGSYSVESLAVQSSGAGFASDQEELFTKEP
ncbi:MAG: dolichyl-phosphate beta-glucosyltransferase [Myxococcales bacterium]